MAKLIFVHSDEWIEKLTTPREELTQPEREAIARHITVCPDCYGIVADFAVLPWLLEALPVPELPPGLPPRLLQLWAAEGPRPRPRKVRRDSTPRITIRSSPLSRDWASGRKIDKPMPYARQLDPLVDTENPYYDKRNKELTE